MNGKVVVSFIYLEFVNKITFNYLSWFFFVGSFGLFRRIELLLL